MQVKIMDRNQGKLILIMLYFKLLLISTSLYSLKIITITSEHIQYTCPDHNQIVSLAD